MALVNRDKDVTEQINVWNKIVDATPSSISAGISNPGVATGNTYVLMTVPYPAQLMAAGSASYGTSGSPVHSLWIYRFAGGFTSIAVGQTLAVTAFGTSGYQGFSIFAGVSYPLQAGDQLVLYTQASNAAVAVTSVGLAVKALQDIKSYFGTSF